MDGAPRFAVSRKRSLVYAVAVTVVMAGALEVAVRGLRSVLRMEPEVPSLHLPHATRLWVMKPGVDWVNPKGKHRVVTNSMGLRNPEIPDGPRRGGRRILVLGDSVSFGYGVDEGESWPRVLERLLEEKRGEGGAPVEVVNAGVLGYGTYQEAETLREFGPRLVPDLVLLQFYPNDPLENYTYRPLSRIERLLPRSAVYNVLRGFYLALRGAREYRVFDDPEGEREAFRKSVALAKERLGTRQEEAVFSLREPEILRECWARTAEAVRRTAAEAGRGGIPLVAVAFPSMSQVMGSNSSTVYQDSLAAICGRFGVPLIDLLESFAGEPGLYRGLHPNADGYAEAARVVMGGLDPFLPPEGGGGG